MRIEEILETDRVWCGYALADLEPGWREHCEWRIHGHALILLFRGFPTPVLFAHGDVDPLIAGLGDSTYYLSVRPPVVDSIRRAGYSVESEKPMWRMALAGPAPGPCSSNQAVPVSADHLPALERLYADGQASGESPDFFFPSMVRQGVFYGIWGENGLLSAAGTHIVAPTTGVAAIGNVYTRRDARGNRLAQQCTAAVTRELLRRGLRTLILNVAQSNVAAIHAYEKLGFTRYCAFREGVARRPTHQ